MRTLYYQELNGGFTLEGNQIMFVGALYLNGKPPTTKDDLVSKAFVDLAFKNIKNNIDVTKELPISYIPHFNGGDLTNSKAGANDFKLPNVTPAATQGRFTPTYDVKGRVLTTQNKLKVPRGDSRKINAPFAKDLAFPWRYANFEGYDKVAKSTLEGMSAREFLSGNDTYISATEPNVIPRGRLQTKIEEPSEFEMTSYKSYANHLDSQVKEVITPMTYTLTDKPPLKTLMTFAAIPAPASRNNATDKVKVLGLDDYKLNFEKITDQKYEDMLMSTHNRHLSASRTTLAAGYEYNISAYINEVGSQYHASLRYSINSEGNPDLDDYMKDEIPKSQVAEFDDKLDITQYFCDKHGHHSFYPVAPFAKNRILHAEGTDGGTVQPLLSKNNEGIQNLPSPINVMQELIAKGTGTLPVVAAPLYYDEDSWVGSGREIYDAHLEIIGQSHAGNPTFLRDGKLVTLPGMNLSTMTGTPVPRLNNVKYYYANEVDYAIADQTPRVSMSTGSTNRVKFKSTDGVSEIFLTEAYRQTLTLTADNSDDTTVFGKTYLFTAKPVFGGWQIVIEEILYSPATETEEEYYSFAPVYFEGIDELGETGLITDPKFHVASVGQTLGILTNRAFYLAKLKK